MNGDADPRALPPLRPELQLLEGASDASGAPRWLIHDPASNRFYQIDGAAFEALSHWSRCGTDADLVDSVNAGGVVTIDKPSVQALLQFLHAHELTARSASGGWSHYLRQHRARQHSALMSLVHNYLFFRIHLFDPQRVLRYSLPIVRWMWSRGWWAVTATAGVAGFYLASRQWDAFLRTFQNWMSFEGAVFALFTLVAVKLVHELGHAYAAVNFGCRVPSMGIAFVVMAPMPYTDVTDAWRLKHRHQRLIIDGGGMLAEMMLAAVAILAWGLLEDGALRSGAFFVATISLASSLAINLNPFMRFDGYYLLSEVTGVENLQSRAFDVGVWSLRELLFGLGAPCPEDGRRARIFWLTVYAWAVWIYRLILFFGIALLVYHFFFKLLGLVLFAVEIVYFIVRPILKEVRAWWELRVAVAARPRGIAVLGMAVCVLVLGMMPLSGRVDVPAIQEAADLQTLHPLRAAQVQAVLVKHGDAVKRGDVIAVLRSPELDDELRRSHISLRIARLQYGRRGADAADKEATLVLESTIAALEAKIAGLERERKDLQIVAPHDGSVAEFNSEVHEGRWVNPREPLALVAGLSGGIVRGYASEADVARIRAGAPGRFIPDFPTRQRLSAEIYSVAPANSSQIEIAELTSVHTGQIPTVVDDRRRLVPLGAQFLVTARVAGPTGSPADLSVRGVLQVEGARESLVGRLFRRALVIIIRESGF